MTNSHPQMKKKETICKCGHPLDEHYDASYGCGVSLDSTMADDLINYCRHCEEDSTWQENPRQGIEEKEL